MVEGLNLFTEYFADYTDHYILIGGTACDVYFTEREIPFRATQDLDIILVVEALNDTFVSHFWQFIQDGEYITAEKNGEKRFYRFEKPKANGYPKKIELFARHPEILKDPPEGMHITDIPTGEDVSSLSAILLNEDYYDFTKNNSEVKGGIRLANEIALVCLKARAYISNKELKAKGAKIQTDNIYKHRRDVLHLATLLNPAKKIQIPDQIKTDLIIFLEQLENESADVAGILKSLKIQTSPDEITMVMRNIFLTE